MLLFLRKHRTHYSRPKRCSQKVLQTRLLYTFPPKTYQYFKYSNSLLFPFDRCRRVASGLLISEVQAFLQKPSSIIIIFIPFVNRTLRRIKSSRLIGLVLHAVTLIFFKEHPSHSALCCDISVELSPFAVKSMFWLRSGPITLQEITYPDLVVARTVRYFIMFTTADFILFLKNLPVAWRGKPRER